MKNCKTMKMYEVYSLDMNQSEEGPVENDRRFLGWLIVNSRKDQLDDKAVLAAMARFRYKDVTGREVAVMSSLVDRRMVYAEDLYQTGEWWEVGRVKGRIPQFGLKQVPHGGELPDKCKTGVFIESYNVDDLLVSHSFSTVKELLDDWNSDDPSMGDNEIMRVAVDGTILYSADQRGKDYEQSFRTSDLEFALEIFYRQ